MGAAEWTGYSSVPDTSSYAPYSPQLPTASGYSYEQSPLVSGDTHGNYHLPPVLPQDGIAQSYCPTEYPSATNSLAQSGMIGCPSSSYPGKSTEMEQYYGNWSNGYNNYQPYACPPPVPVLPTAQPYNPNPTMVLYPQLYSTVNQNQIHLHLHGTGPEKLEQYLDNFTIGSISTDGMSNLNRNPPSIDVGMSANDSLAQEPPAVIIKHQQEEPEEIQNNQEVIGDSNKPNWWRPY